MIRVGIVDDHLLFRKSMSLLIDSFKNIKTVLVAENGKVFLEKIIDNPIDVVLLDIQMPVMNGYQTCEKILELYPDVKILIVSQLSTKESIHKVIELGAHGYFTKNSDPEQLENAIRSINDKGFYFGVELGLVIKEAMLWDKTNSQDLEKEINIFSERELQIIKMICKEKKSKEIAQLLFINVRTVDSHRKNIMDKSNTKNFVGVILYALKNNLIEIEEI